MTVGSPTVGVDVASVTFVELGDGVGVNVGDAGNSVWVAVAEGTKTVTEGLAVASWNVRVELGVALALSSPLGVAVGAGEALSVAVTVLDGLVVTVGVGVSTGVCAVGDTVAEAVRFAVAVALGVATAVGVGVLTRTMARTKSAAPTLPSPFKSIPTHVGIPPNAAPITAATLSSRANPSHAPSCARAIPPHPDSRPNTPATASKRGPAVPPPTSDFSLFIVAALTTCADSSQLKRAHARRPHARLPAHPPSGSDHSLLSPERDAVIQLLCCTRDTPGPTYQTTSRRP